MKRKILFLVLILALLLSGCATGVVNEPQTEPGAAVKAATPTPEVFIPLDPSPVPAESDLPLTCQVTDLNVYVDEEAGYCFAYPTAFTLQYPSPEGILLAGPALEDSPDPLYASLGVSVQPAPAGSSLARLVDGYLSQSGFQGLPWEIERSGLSLGGEPAERVEPIPGLGSSRQVLALHGDRLFTLRFHPLDFAVAEADVEALYQTVTGSFAFLDGALQTPTQSGVNTVEWSEFGQKISLDYDPRLAPWVETLSLPAVPNDGQVLYSASHPVMAQFRFLGYRGGWLYELPFLPEENAMAQVTVLRTADFAGFGDGEPSGFPNQLQVLSNLLQDGVDPTRCAEPLYAVDQSLPFLPWVNSRQTFCAQPQIVEFAGGKGLRYLTQYSQGPDAALEGRVFYTFQGLSADGRYYISAAFPVLTGFLPSQPPAAQINPDPSGFIGPMKEQVQQLNAQSPGSFDPLLTTLDELVASIKIEPAD